MLGENDLFVCFLGAPAGNATRVGIWHAEGESNPTELDSLTPGTRRLLAAMSLPAQFETRRRLGRRSEEDLLAALTRPFQTNASLLDRRGVNATARSRGRHSVEQELRRHGLDADDYFAMATTGEYSAPRVKADVVELVRAVQEERWEVARHILAVASMPLWRDVAAPAIDVDALTPAPEMITDPAAREMIERAVRDAAAYPPSATPVDGRAHVASPSPRHTAGREHIDPPQPNRRASLTSGRATCGLVVLIALAAAIFLLMSGGGRDDGASRLTARGPGIVLTVYNRVTNGPHGMREDPGPVQLTRHPRPFCDAARCIARTARNSGQVYESAICETIGDSPAMTNADLVTDKAGRADDHNAGVYSSLTYYGVRLPNGIEGYVSDVWVQPSQRAGKLELPPCAADFAKG